MGERPVDIRFTSLSLVAHDAPPRAPHLDENIEVKVQAFFVAHIEALRAMSRGPDAPPAGRITDTESQALFQTLQMGDATDFAGAAGILAKRLIGRMNRSTRKGLLACVRAEEEQDRLTAVLKLEIDPSNGTRLEELASGEIRLAAVTNVLEQPGDLQKGILVDSRTPAEEVLCGDIHASHARYFPEAFGIQAYAKPSQGPSALLKTAAQHDTDLAARIAAALPRVRSGPLPEVISEISGHVPALDRDTQSELIDSLEQSPRPVAYIDTGKQVTMTIGDGEIIIKGSAESLHEQVELHETAEGWEARVRFAGKPATRYR